MQKVDTVFIHMMMLLELLFMYFLKLIKLRKTGFWWDVLQLIAIIQFDLDFSFKKIIRNIFLKLKKFKKTIKTTWKILGATPNRSLNES